MSDIQFDEPAPCGSVLVNHNGGMFLLTRDNKYIPCKGYFVTGEIHETE